VAFVVLALLSILLSHQNKGRMEIKREKLYPKKEKEE